MDQNTEIEPLNTDKTMCDDEDEPPKKCKRVEEDKPRDAICIDLIANATSYTIDNDLQLIQDSLQCSILQQWVKQKNILKSYTHILCFGALLNRYTNQQCHHSKMNPSSFCMNIYSARITLLHQGI